MFTALKALISRGSASGEGFGDSSVSVPRTDIRGPVVTPIGTVGTHVSPDELQEMIQAYESGESLISIASARRLGKQTVSRLLSEAGVRIRRQGLDEEQIARAVLEFEAGQTTREIAADLGVGHSMVWRALKRAEVELRPNARRKGRSRA